MLMDVLQVLLLTAIAVELGLLVRRLPATVLTANTTALTAAAEIPPLIPENTTHQWGPRLPRPPKVIKPAPSPRGNCAFLVKRADNGVLVGSRPPGHPDEIEALANPRLSVEYLHEGGM